MSAYLPSFQEGVYLQVNDGFWSLSYTKCNQGRAHTQSPLWQYWGHWPTMCLSFFCSFWPLQSLTSRGPTLKQFLVKTPRTACLLVISKQAVLGDISVVLLPRVMGECGKLWFSDLSLSLSLAPSLPLPSPFHVAPPPPPTPFTCLTCYEEGQVSQAERPHGVSHINQTGASSSAQGHPSGGNVQTGP